MSERPAALPELSEPAWRTPGAARSGASAEKRQVSGETFPILPELAGASLTADTLGHSDAQVWHVSWPDGREAWLKEQPAGGPEPLERDCRLLSWLKGRVPVPEVLAYQRDSAGETAREYLLMSAMPGKPASDSEFLTQAETLIPLLARALRQLHALPIAHCPFDARLDAKFRLAADHVAAGRIDESDFQTPFLGKTATELYARLLAERPQGEEDLVFTHGDACLPNYLIADGAFQGFIDIGRGGVADRWQDLALLIRSLQFNGFFTWENVEKLLEVYGTPLDKAKLDFYILLDEFF